MDLFDFFGGCLTDWMWFGWATQTRAGCLFSSGLLVTTIAGVVLFLNGVDWRWLVAGFIVINVLWLVIVSRIGD